MSALKTLFKRTSRASPAPQPEDPRKVKWIARYSVPQIGHAIDAEQAYNQSMGEAKAFLENGFIERGNVVLDLGSGNGRQAIGLVEMGVGRYVGIEPIRTCVEFASKIFQDYSQCEFVWIDLKNDMYNPAGTIDPLDFKIPFEDNSFDAAIAGSLFTHLGKFLVCDHYLGQLHRVLKPGGKLFCSWFRSPPNQLNSGHERSVFKEAEIITLVTKYFKVYHSSGGTTDSHHDQWCLFCHR
jgi:ubiquinone/menaquinone biosynthesis C-methylase UbiE